MPPNVGAKVSELCVHLEECPAEISSAPPSFYRIPSVVSWFILPKLSQQLKECEMSYKYILALPSPDLITFVKKNRSNRNFQLEILM
jgi:hypothetical protein